MHRTLAALAVAALLPWLAPARDVGPKKPSDELATDIDRPASPPRPAPKWVELQDLGKQDKRLAGYRAPTGIKVEVVAAAPAVVNPAGLAFTPDGVPLVIEWSHDAEKPTLGEETFDFQDGSKRKVRVLKKAKKDAIKALSSSKKDGTWDTATPVLEDELPSTVLPFDGWLYVAGRGSVRRYKQAKAGGPYDRMEYVARGFGGVGRHQVSGLTIGPEGMLYISCGDGDHLVEGSDGSRATVLRSGAVFRCEADGSKLHVFAQGFRNPYRDVAFDLGGNCFHLDGDSPGDAKRFVGCRLLHLVEGGDYGWRLAHGSGKADPDRAAAFGEKPGTLPGMLKTGAGSPAGVLIYNDTQLPNEYRGLLFYPDPARRVVRAYQVEPRGATFQVVEEFEFLSGGKDESFHPCQMVTGPDGAIYVVDFRSDVAEGRLCGDGKGGRILRISWAGTKEEPATELRPMDSWAKVAKLKDEELIAELSSFDATVRERARRELVKRGDKNRAALLKVLADGEGRAVVRMAAAGALVRMYDEKVQAALALALEKGDDELKRACAEALGLFAKKGDTSAQDALLKAITQKDPAVRRAVCVAMGRLAGEGAGDGLSSAFSFDAGDDVFVRDGILRGLEALGKDGITALLSLADSGVQMDTDRVVEAFLAMRGRAAAEALPTILRHMHVSAAQRAELIRAFANYQLEPPVTTEAIVEFVVKNKEKTDVRRALGALLATPGVRKGKKGVEWCKEALVGDDEKLAASAVAALADSAEGAVHVGKLMAQKKLPEALRPAVTAALKRHAGADKEAAKLLKELAEK